MSRYEHWKDANYPSFFSWFDYAHCVLRERQVAADFAIAIARIVWPNFIEIDGLIFLADQYSDEKVSSLRTQGVAGQQLEYWMNLFSIDGFFSGVDSTTQEDEEQFAGMLVCTWKAKLQSEFITRDFVVEIAKDDAAGDLCVVFTQRDIVA
jgi:hypothetical protein